MERSRRFYEDVLGFVTAHERPRQRRISAHTWGPETITIWDCSRSLESVRPPDQTVARMYHSAWEVWELRDLARAAMRLSKAGALAGASDHGASLSLYSKDPDGLEFEIFGRSLTVMPACRRKALDLPRELARRGDRLAGVRLAA